MDLTSILFGPFLSLCLTIVAGVAVHRTNKVKDSIDKAINDITVLQQTTVTDSHVRKILKEELQQFSANSEKMLLSMHKIEVFIAEQKGYSLARREYRQTRAADYTPSSPE